MFILMNCPYCKSNTFVTNSRSRSKGTQVWRRRQCKNCHGLWTTHEVIDLSTSHKIENRTGTLQPFSRDKLFISIMSALRHRKSALTDATALTDTVSSRVLATKTAKLSTNQLLESTHHVLMMFDKTAAAVYMQSHL